MYPGWRRTRPPGRKGVSWTHTTGYLFDVAHSSRPSRLAMLWSQLADAILRVLLLMGTWFIVLSFDASEVIRDFFHIVAGVAHLLQGAHEVVDVQAVGGSCGTSGGHIDDARHEGPPLPQRLREVGVVARVGARG